MGALTDPVRLGRTQVVSGDVVSFAPSGWRRLFHRPFLGVVDVRDRSVPYLVRERKGRVLRVPLDGAPFAGPGWTWTVFRLAGIDKGRAATVAARAAQRMGEGIHHPDYDCGRTVGSDEALVADAYAAIDVPLTFASGRPHELAEVKGPQDPPNDIVRDDASPTDRGGRAWVERGVEKTLPWQKRTRR